MIVPKVFVSYSHDSLEHKKWVIDLSTRLMSNGIEVSLDQWDVSPGDDTHKYMEKGISEADRILLICTKQYVQKANSGVGGVAYESMMMPATISDDIYSNKLIPIIRQDGAQDVPNFLKTKLHLNLSGEDFEYQYDELVRSIHGKALFKKPEVTNNPFKPNAIEKNLELESALKVAMEFIVACYEDRKKLSYKNLSLYHKGTRIMLDLGLCECVNKGLIEEYDNYYYFNLTNKGRKYAMQNIDGIKLDLPPF
jgi:hypothetical protein